MKFGHLIIRKIIKFVATRCQILRLKCTKFNFDWGSAPDPTGGAYSAPQTPIAVFKGPTSKGEVMKVWDGKRGGEKWGMGQRAEREGK